MAQSSDNVNPRNALVHLAWLRDKEERHLIFGWLELLPAAMPNLRGHPFVAHKVKAAEHAYVNVARFPMSADAAERWYSDAAAGSLRLPGHPDRPTAGDGALIVAPPTAAEPEDGSESLAMGLPFLPASHGAVYVRGLFPDLPQDSDLGLEDAETAVWLAENLFFDLREHRFYLGSLLHVRYGSRLRAVQRHLQPRSNGDDEVIRLVTWPGKSMAGAELIAVERRPLGLSPVIRAPIADPVVRISWPRRVGHTGLAIIDPEEGLCWWSDILPFVRTIALNMDIGGNRREVVIEGKTSERYEVTERIPVRDSQPIIIGDAPNPFSVSARHINAAAARERRRFSVALGVRWFDDPTTAASHVRALLQAARQYARIIDPYFTGVEVVRFALAVPSKAVPVEIVTSAEHLRKHVNGIELGEALETVLRDVKRHVTISAKVLAGESAPLHDRFLVIDGRVWLSGNSLNAIGERASVLIEIPDPEEILEHLNPILKDAKTFEQWLAERRARRKKTLWTRLKDAVKALSSTK
jgi:hypothetical protein